VGQARQAQDVMSQNFPQHATEYVLFDSRSLWVSSPYAESTGAGTALVLRGGKAWTTHWSRPNANGGATFTTTPPPPPPPASA
jgi:hypothetical protein